MYMNSTFVYIEYGIALPFSGGELIYVSDLDPAPISFLARGYDN